MTEALCRICGADTSLSSYVPLGGGKFYVCDSPKCKRKAVELARYGDHEDQLRPHLPLAIDDWEIVHEQSGIGGPAQLKPPAGHGWWLVENHATEGTLVSVWARRLIKQEENPQ